ncbi:MAG: ribosome biogenesis GTPase Der, partial [Nitrospirota bacterium]
EDAVYDFYSLGVDEVLPVSALHGQGFGEMMDRLIDMLPPESATPDDEEAAANVAIIGRPNVGKSSLLNALTGEKRAVTDNTPGTTVDPVDTTVTYYGRQYNLVDTAGIRSRGKIAAGVEKYSVLRAVKAVERCDVALLLIDAAEGLTEQDKKIGGIAHEEGKGIIIVLNKWDLVEKDTNTLNEYTQRVREGMKFLDYASIIAISALTRQRIGKIYQLVDEVVEHGRTRVPTPKLNDLLINAVKAQPPGMYKGHGIKFYYATQAGVSPPTFVVFVNRPEGVHFSYLRYIENRLRREFGFQGNPIRIFLKRRRRGESVPGES